MGKQSWRGGNMLYPVPAVMVSCARPGEKPNIITVAWAGTVCSAPAMLSISVRKERYSYDIIKETGEFVVNLVTKDLVFATDYCGVKSGRDTDKFQEMKLTPLPSQHISAPGIAESPLNLECRVKQVVELGSHDMFIAEILGVTVDDRYMDEKGTFHLNDAKLVSYSHGTYFELGEKIGTFGYSVRKDSKNKSKRSDIAKDSKMKSNITLVGMPASGKSTIGVLLAKRLGYSFVDVDIVIQEKTGQLLKEIIAERGTEGFLKVEESVNAELETERSVIAPGGSVIYGPKAMEHLHEISTVVYLKLSYEDVKQRLGDLKDRGVALKDGMTLLDLYNERVPLYEKYADVTIDETGKTLGACVDELRRIMENRMENGELAR